LICRLNLDPDLAAAADKVVAAPGFASLSASAQLKKLAPFLRAQNERDGGRENRQAA
jgi:hypothetical protein